MFPSGWRMILAWLLAFWRGWLLPVLLLLIALGFAVWLGFSRL